MPWRVSERMGHSRALIGRARQSVEGPLFLLGGACFWGLVIVASYLAWEWRLTGFNRFHLPVTVAIHFGAGFLGFLGGVPVARFLAMGRPPETRLAGTFLCLSSGTLGFMLALLYLQYRRFYAQWHDPFLTKTWVIQQIETVLGAGYQYLVLGLPHLLPIAFPLLVLTSFAVAKRMR